MTQEDLQDFRRIIESGNLDKRNCKSLRAIWNRYEPKEYQCFCQPEERMEFWEEATRWLQQHNTLNDE